MTKQLTKLSQLKAFVAPRWAVNLHDMSTSLTRAVCFIHLWQRRRRRLATHKSHSLFWRPTTITISYHHTHILNYTITTTTIATTLVLMAVKVVRF